MFRALLRGLLAVCCAGVASPFALLLGAPLYPDLVVEIHQPMQEEVDGAPVLKFATWTINLGEGPVELHALTEQNGMKDVDQWIFDSNGTSHTEVRTGTFVFDGTRVRFNESADYFLREVMADDSLGSIVSANEKVAFCFVDSFILPLARRPPNTPPSRVYGSSSYPACGNILGTSVGWVDQYPVNFAGQVLPLTGVTSGTYWLENIVDPLNRLVESNDNNNLARIKVTVETEFTSEMAVLGNNQLIRSNDMRPSAADHTNFGEAALGGSAITRTFAIQNSGSGKLSLLGRPRVQVVGSSDFAVVTQPVSPVVPNGGSTTFQLAFRPQSSGTKSATVRISNNDSDEGTYQFRVRGNALGISQADFSEIGFRLRFHSLIGRSYRVDYNDSLSAAGWTLLEERPGTGAEMEITDRDPPSDSARFYRLSSSP